MGLCNFKYIKFFHETKYGDFYEKHYVPVDSANINLKSNPNNLILVSLESFEKNFADRAFYKRSMLEPLENIELRGFSFSNYENGYNQTPTTPSMFATMMGIPSTATKKIFTHRLRLKDHCFNNVKALGDVLKSSGYKTISIQGSDSRFQGVDVFEKNHGIDERIDARYIQKNYPQYKEINSWGFSDKTVFSIAKDKLKTTASPFFLYIRTVDTHEKDIPKTNINYGFNNILKNTIYNTAKETADFVGWALNQEFAKNTTIVLIGDHLRSGVFFEVPEKRFVYNLFINSKIEPLNINKRFSQIDLFPSILEAIGFEVPGHRLGIGTSIFSKEKTLIEKYSKENLEILIDMPNKLYEQLWK
ncbi:MAG: LTA synthase family protein [Alphaproteobacteria bacterium]|nr:LTA synthase family protein [Alphaproteobacteria bacterium]